MTRGVSQVALESGVPIATGILTLDNLEQAIDRAGLKAGNKGAHAAQALLEMMSLQSQLIEEGRLGKSKGNRDLSALRIIRNRRR